MVSGYGFGQSPSSHRAVRRALGTRMGLRLYAFVANLNISARGFKVERARN
jgi:hypothetical protein